jgi:hypothetical protein
VPGTPLAFPVFAAAFQPTGSLLHENMYTSREDVTGGHVPASAGPVRVTPPWHHRQSRPGPHSESRGDARERHRQRGRQAVTGGIPDQVSQAIRGSGGPAR